MTHCQTNHKPELTSDDVSVAVAAYVGRCSQWMNVHRNCYSSLQNKCWSYPQRTKNRRISVAGTRADIYLCLLLRSVRFYFSKIRICVNTVITKSACPTAAEKCLSALICLPRICRSQPLSSVSRKQRYNILDFLKENRVPTSMLLAPIGNPEPKDLRPSGHPFMFVRRPSIPSGAVGFSCPNMKPSHRFNSLFDLKSVCCFTIMMLLSEPHFHESDL